MYRAGVRLVSGADAGIGAFKPHGVLPMAISDFVAGGIPITHALASATSHAADACGLGHRKGRLRTGHDADLLIVNGDPLSDISALTQTLAVIMHGEHAT